MAPPEFHPANLLVLAVDAKKMEAVRAPLNQALQMVIARHKDFDRERQAVLIGANQAKDVLNFNMEVFAPAVDNAALRPMLNTVHLVVAAIFDLVKDSPPDDDTAFDNALAKATTALQQHKIDPLLAPIFVETAMAAIHAKIFADVVVITLYSDGRLLALKGSLLARLLQTYHESSQKRASAQ